jgi:protease-4
MSDRPSAITRFFGFIWRVVEFIRRVLVTLVVLVTVLMLWVFLSGPPRWPVEDNIALVWAPVGEIVETLDEAPEKALLEQLANIRPRRTLTRDLVDTLRLAAMDDRVRLVFLKVDELEYAGMAQLEELGAAIQEFRKSGKKVIAFAHSYTQEQYYLAAQADETYLDPMGIVLVAGFGMYNYYFKEALDKLGVDVHVFRVGEYKSAVEPFERSDMSPESRAANTAWLTGLWDAYKSGVASPRKLKQEDIENYAATFPQLLEQHQGDTAQTAKVAGLVDELRTLEQVRAQVGAIVGMDDEIRSFRQIDSDSYLRSVREDHAPAPDAPAIGVVVAQGELIDGEGVPGMTGSDTMADLIGQAIEDDGIAALVLRVDSPGGSITASETIRRAVQRFRETGRPVVVSMSSLAASGGYWIATDADEIWAQGTTLTGSIGVFGLIPTVDKPLGKLGIRVDGVGTTPMAGALRSDMPMKPEMKQAVQRIVEKDYRQFIQQVAQGRKMELDAVDKIARGRVWSGSDAKRLGLVDNLGGQREAILAAARLAELKPDGFRVEPIEAPREFARDLLERLSMGIARLGYSPLDELFATWRERIQQIGNWKSALGWLNDPQGIYAHCFCRPAIGTQMR